MKQTKFNQLRAAQIATIVIVLMTGFPANQAAASGPTVNIALVKQCAAFAKNTESAKEVTSVLADLLPNVVSGETIKANVGRFSDSRELMLASGMRTEVVQFADTLIKRMIDRERGGASALGNTASRLHDLKQDENALLICALSETCRLKCGGALHVAISNQDFDIVPFRSTGGATSKPGRVTLTALEKNSIEYHFPRVIVMNGGPKVEAVGWVTNFWHEATHFADFALISEWIKANVKLMSSGKIPDELFSTYVRMSPSGRFEIDEGFLRIFLESRAYLVEIAGFRGLVPPSAFEPMLKQQRQYAMEDIHSFDAVTHFTAQRLNLSIDNVFEVGERLGQLMLNSISK